MSNKSKITNEISRSAKEIFFDRTSQSSDATNFAKAIETALHDNKVFEVHYTYTNGADMRIRTKYNVMVITWRPKSGVYNCSTLDGLGIQADQHNGITDIKLQAGLTLSQSFKIDPSTCTTESILRIIHSAAKNDSRGDSRKR